MTSSRQIQLSDELCDRIEQRFGSQLENIEQLVTFVLEELLRDDPARMDEAEQRTIENRLRDLGYL